jgi:glycine cleavage system transcriptional repressor
MMAPERVHFSRDCHFGNPVYAYGMVEDAVLVATGSDRPGVMDELSQFLLTCGGNITDSHAVNLRGQFAMLLLLRCEHDALEAIRQGLPSLVDKGIRAELKPASGTPAVEAATFPYRFVARGKDQAGVLHRVSHLLRVLKINIDNIETHVTPGSGEFEVRLDLSVPRETPVTMVREYLTYLCNELKITSELTET